MVCFLITSCSGIAGGISWLVNYLGAGKSSVWESLLSPAVSARCTENADQYIHKNNSPCKQSVHDRNTAVVLLRSHTAAEGGRCRFFAEKITVLLQLLTGIWAVACSSLQWILWRWLQSCPSCPGGTSRSNVSGWHKLGKC